MYTIKQLQEWHVHIEANGEWVEAKPICIPLLWRVKDAWQVLIGRADAFKWPAPKS